MKLRYLLTVACVAIGLNGFGQTTYYISAQGTDSGAGTSAAKAWKSIQQINAKKLQPGDRLLFRRGDTFFGQLKINTASISIDAYGVGNKPVISGEEKVSGKWILTDNNIWETKIIAKNSSDLNSLYKNNHVQPLSRYPNMEVNNGYLNFESHEGAVKFTDKELSNAINWTGAEIVIRAELFRLVRTKVMKHEANKIELEGTKSIARLRDGFGYFFVNDRRAMDQEGEWAYDKATGKILLYSIADPNKDAFSYPAIDTLISALKADRFTIKNMKIAKAGKLGIAVNNASDVVIDAVEIINSGGDGLIFNACTHGVLQNSLIANMNWSGVFSTSNSDDILFKDNTVRNIGNSAYGKSKTFIGIDCNSAHSQILGNTVVNTGYAGIICCGRDNLVKRNVVDSVCQFLEDMGGIYTNNNINNTTGTVIEENTVTNSFCMQGGGAGEHSLANGIYLDNRSQGVTVRNNTVAYVNGSGIFIHSTLRDNKIYDNTSFQSGYSEFYITNPDTVPRYEVERNILVANTASEGHVVLLTGKTGKYVFEEIGQFKDNYIVNPYHTKTVKVNYKDGTIAQLKRVSVEEWAQLSGGSVSGNKATALKYAPVQFSAEKIKLYSNSGKVARKFSLASGNYTDVKGKVYKGSLSVKPYSSLILFKIN